MDIETVEHSQLELMILHHDIERAKEILAEIGMSMRVTTREGVPMIVTRDYKLTRVNVAVRGGKVVAVMGMG